MRIKRLGLLILAIIMSLCFAGCGTEQGSDYKNNKSSDDKNNKSSGDKNDKSEVVATVNGENITLNNLKFYLLTQVVYPLQNEYMEKNPEAQNVDWNAEWENGKPLAQTARERALDLAIDAELYRQKAKDYDCALTKEDNDTILQQFNNTKDNLDKQQTNGFKVAMDEVGLTEASFKKSLETQAVTPKIQAYVTEHPEIFDELVGLDTPNKVSAKHILIVTLDQQTNAPLPEEQIAAKKDEINNIKKQLDEGGDFDAIMKEKNEDPGEPAVGYSVPKGRMVPSFENAAFALQLDQISDVVESNYGYHIIKRVTGLAELEQKWRNDSKIKIKNDILEKLEMPAQ